SNFDPVFGASNAQGDLLLDFVMGMMFIVLPGFWIIALGWSGIKLGNLVGGLATATSSAKEAGGSGSQVLIDVAKGKI
ncbi:hypothetical protein ALP71_04494, partial [Pseudomonas coronafaciens pv. garcae]